MSYGGVISARLERVSVLLLVGQGRACLTSDRLEAVWGDEAAW